MIVTIVLRIHRLLPLQKENSSFFHLVTFLEPLYLLVLNFTINTEKRETEGRQCPFCSSGFSGFLT